MGDGGLSLKSLTNLQATLQEDDCILKEPGEFCTIRLALKDDEHEYILSINGGKVLSISVDQSIVPGASDLRISASSTAWKGYLQRIPPPEYSDLMNMVTEKVAVLTGNLLLYYQNVEYITGLMRYLGHRSVLTVENGEKARHTDVHGSIEKTIGRYIYLTIDDHTYRIFYEESGTQDGIPLVLLHAANSDARMWRHQLNDPDLSSKHRMLAFDMPWRGRSIPPQELLRTEYLLTCDFYMKLVRSFCEALELQRPILMGCSMGGYLQFHIAHKQPGYYRALIAVAARDFEERRWELEKILRHPAISFNRSIPSGVRGFMAPNDPIGCADETAYVYETGNPKALRGDLHFAALDADARSFMGEIDCTATPFYLLGGEYDWSCTAEHTDAIKSRLPGIEIVRMEGIGHFPPDENPEVFKKYVLPVLSKITGNVST